MTEPNNSTPLESTVPEGGAAGADPIRRERTFGDAAKEFVGAWVLIWLVSLFVLDEPFAPTLMWLLYSLQNALLVPLLACYLPILLVSLLARRILGKSGWWQAHRFAIIVTLILSGLSLYGLSKGG